MRIVPFLSISVIPFLLAVVALHAQEGAGDVASFDSLAMRIVADRLEHTKRIHPSDPIDQREDDGEGIAHDSFTLMREGRSVRVYRFNDPRTSAHRRYILAITPYGGVFTLAGFGIDCHPDMVEYLFDSIEVDEMSAVVSTLEEIGHFERRYSSLRLRDRSDASYYYQFQRDDDRRNWITQVDFRGGRVDTIRSFAPNDSPPIAPPASYCSDTAIRIKANLLRRLAHDVDSTDVNNPANARFLDAFPSDFQEFVCLFGSRDPGFLPTYPAHEGLFDYEGPFWHLYEKQESPLQLYAALNRLSGEAMAEKNFALAVGGYYNYGPEWDLAEIVRHGLKDFPEEYFRLLDRASDSAVIGFAHFVIETGSGPERPFYEQLLAAVGKNDRMRRLFREAFVQLEKAWEDA